MSDTDILAQKDMFGEVPKADTGNILRDKFLIPPFSVLSARDGEWQKRKRQWIALGIQSELGRGEGITWGDSEEMRHPQLNYYREKNKGLARCFGQDLMEGENPNFRQDKKKNVRGLLGKSFPTIHPYDGYEQQDGTVSTSGTSIFDPVLCELMYSWFCPKGGQIIDPLAGGSVRGIVASILGYRYWGCDLSSKQIDANREQALKICPDGIIRWVVGDALKELPKAPEADFIFTCPPYGDLEVYSDDPADLSAMGYPKFIKTLGEIIGLACGKLRQNRFACIVVGDFRDEGGFYHNFVGDVINAFQGYTVKLYNEIILVTVVGSLPIRVDKQFEAGRKVGKTHQNVLVFYKGNPKKIRAYFTDGNALIV